MKLLVVIRNGSAQIHGVIPYPRKHYRADYARRLIEKTIPKADRDRFDLQPDGLTNLLGRPPLKAAG